MAIGDRFLLVAKIGYGIHNMGRCYGRRELELNISRKQVPPGSLNVLDADGQPIWPRDTVCINKRIDLCLWSMAYSTVPCTVAAWSRVVDYLPFERGGGEETLRQGSRVVFGIIVDNYEDRIVHPDLLIQGNQQLCNAMTGIVGWYDHRNLACLR